jgi:hypothetical protein
MRELSLHILDVAENAIQAGACHVKLSIVENLYADQLVITVQDDGRGMDAETAARVRDPFFTTRSTRHVGLGIPLFAAAAARCAGGLEIQSALGKGTTVTATFQHSHIDRAPLGDMSSTLMCILMRREDLTLDYRHCIVKGSSERIFELDTGQIKDQLGDVPLSHPEVRKWLGEFVAQGEQDLRII